MIDFNKIPAHIIMAAISDIWYFDAILDYHRDGLSYMAAYIRLESELDVYGLPGRYSCYQSFMVCKNKKHGKNKNRKDKAQETRKTAE